MTPLFDGPVDWQPILLAAVPTLLVAGVMAHVARRLVKSALVAILGEGLATSSPLVRGPLRLVGLAVFLLVAAVLLFPAFEMAGLKPRAGIQLSFVTAWLFGSGLKVILIAIFAYAFIKATELIIKRFEYELTTGSGIDALERAKRARTLGAALNRLVTVAVTVIAVLMVLREFRVDIAPVLTGAGIAGLAVGFGAQTLVRDIISGFFLILEDQVRVGDVAAINGTGGLVEEINLRTIVLRDLEGTVHVFPNGAISTLANRSKDFSYYVIDLPVSYAEDSDRVVELLKAIGAEMQSDPLYGPMILEPLEVLGLDAFGEWWAKLKLRIKTVPLKQWEVGRELRRRIKKAFERHGIHIPTPALMAPAREEPAPERPQSERPQ